MTTYSPLTPRTTYAPARGTRAYRVRHHVRTAFNTACALTTCALVALLTVWCLTLASACPTEDSVQCTWYGSEQGNGEGLTFTAITDTLIVRW